MRHVALLVLLLTGAAFLTSCGGGGTGISSAGSSNPGYGPFDRNGNYVEAWADRPAKKHRWARDAPAAPIKEEKKEPVVASSNQPKPQPTTKKKATSRETEIASLNRRLQPPPQRSSPPPAPKPVAYKPPPAKPKPKPAPVKPKASPSIRHTVAKGDTLYNISRRHNTTVSKIQRANGISGTTIRVGQTLVIPR